MEHFNIEQIKKMKEICREIFSYIHKEIVPHLHEDITIYIESGKGEKELIMMIFPKSKKPIKLIKGKGYDIYNTPEHDEYDFFNEPNLTFTKEMWQIISNWKDGKYIKDLLWDKVRESKLFSQKLNDFTV